MLVLLKSLVEYLVKMADKFPVVGLLLSTEEDNFVLSIYQSVHKQDALDFIEVVSKYIEQIYAVLLVEKA